MRTLDSTQLELVAEKIGVTKDVVSSYLTNYVHTQYIIDVLVFIILFIGFIAVGFYIAKLKREKTTWREMLSKNDSLVALFLFGLFLMFGGYFSKNHLPGLIAYNEDPKILEQIKLKEFYESFK